jgi:hypothetical protein
MNTVGPFLPNQSRASASAPRPPKARRRGIPLHRVLGWGLVGVGLILCTSLRSKSPPAPRSLLGEGFLRFHEVLSIAPEELSQIGLCS